jgi:hypothetical protein
LIRYHLLSHRSARTMWCATCSAQRATYDADLQHVARTGTTQHAAVSMQDATFTSDRRPTRVITLAFLSGTSPSTTSTTRALRTASRSGCRRALDSRPAHATPSASFFSASCERAATRRLCRSVPNSSIQSQTERECNATRSCSNRLYAHPNMHSRTYPCGQRWRVGSPARAGAIRHRAAVRHNRARHMEGSGPHTRTRTGTSTYTHAHTRTHTHTHVSAHQRTRAHTTRTPHAHARSTLCVNVSMQPDAAPTPSALLRVCTWPRKPVRF